MTGQPSANLRPAAQYVRMSTDRQRYSIENQCVAIGEYAEAHGFEVVQSYEDAGRSGVTVKRREGLKALLRDVMAGDAPFRTILVLDVSRWGRFQDPDEAAHYEFICREAGVRVEYCSESFENDGSTSAAILKTLKRVMAGEYSRQLATRVRDGKQRQVAQGLHGGGYAAYGVRRQAFNSDGTPDRVLEAGERRSRLEQTVKLVRGPDEEVRTTRKIFALFVKQNYLPAEIARYLNDHGVSFPRGGPWNYYRVRSVLENELAIGIRVYARNRTGLLHPHGIAPPEEWQRIKVLNPIVSVATFEAAQRRLAELTRDRISNEEMLRRLKVAVRKIKGNVTHRKLLEAGLAQSTYAKRFGSMRAVWKLIGRPEQPDFYRSGDPQSYTRESIVARLKELYEQHGFLNVALLNKTAGLPSVSFIIRLFGSVFEAYRAAGYESTHSEAIKRSWRRRRSQAEGSGYRHNFTREQMIDRLRELYAEHGYLSISLLRASPGLPSTTAIGREFGGMLKAYRAVGLKLDQGGAIRAAWGRRAALVGVSSKEKTPGPRVGTIRGEDNERDR